MTVHERQAQDPEDPIGSTQTLGTMWVTKSALTQLMKLVYLVSQVTLTAMAAKTRNVNQFPPAAVTNIAAMSTALTATFKRSSIQS